MAAVTEVGSTLLMKCLDFCQALSSQGQVFNFSVAIGPDFTFSLDTRSKAASPVSKKKASPSTLKRNARRREDYLKRKHNPSSVNSIEEVEVASNVLNCDLCDYKAGSEKGLKTHKRMKHGPPRLTPPAASPTSPENLRGPGQMRSALSASPLLNTCREESTINPDVVVGDLSPPKSVRKHICPSFLCSRYQCPNETEEQKRHYQKMQELLEKGSF